MSQPSPKQGQKVLHRLRNLKWNLKAGPHDHEKEVNHRHHDEFPPVSSTNDEEKKPWINIDPRWKVRIQAVVIICFLVVPGNLVTLFIYVTSDGLSTSQNETLNNGRNESNYTDDYSEFDLFDNDYISDDNFTLINETEDDGNSSSYLTEDGYFCHEKYEVIIPVLDSVNFWIEGVTLTTIAIFGLLGNLLTVVVILNFDRAPGPHNPIGGGGRSPFNTILITLVAFDSFFLIFSLFDSGLLASFHMPEPHWYKVIFPYVWHPLKNVVTSGCVFMVVAVATERYFAICKPLFVKPRPSFFITLVVVSSITINVPKFFEFNHIYDENNTLQYWTSDLNENANYVVFSSYYECAVIGVIPLLALCYLNYKIYIGISKSAKSMIRHTGGTTSTISTTADSRNSSLCRTNNLRVQHHRNGQAEQVPLLLMGKFSNKKATPETPANLPQNRLSFVDQNPNGISRSQSSPRDVNDSGNNGCTQSRISSVLKGEKKHFQNRKEKSTGILVGIILVFVLCHIFRLCIQVYEIVSPTHGLHTHFYKCEELKRLHVPAVVLVAGSVNHLLLVTNSSVNFVIYCCMARRFRKALIDLFRSWRCYCRCQEEVNDLALASSAAAPPPISNFFSTSKGRQRGFGGEDASSRYN